jgi:GNAT superfamily N-acetyltransferase
MAERILCLNFLTERSDKMETIDIRPAVTRSELEQAYDLWATVFPEDRSFFQERLDYDTTYRMETTWIASVNGTIASSAQIFPYRMRWGSAELKVGGIGNVATLPQFRGRGLAQRLLRRQSEYMASHGYDLSLLFTDKHSFYEQVGWRTVADPVLAADAFALRRYAESKPPYRIRPFEEASDLTQVSRMYAQFIDEWSGPMLRTIDYWRGQSAWKAVWPEHFLVAEAGGRLAAYLRYKITRKSELQIADCCYEPGQEQAAKALLLAAAAAEKHAVKVKAQLPSGHILHDELRKHGAVVEADSSKMWKAFSLADTVSKIAPELALRIRRANGPGKPELPAAILLAVGDEEALVRVWEEAVEAEPVTDSVSYNAAITLSEIEWVNLLLKGSGALERPLPSGSEYLRALFPERPYVFWPVDNF